MTERLESPVLGAVGVPHGFGVRGSSPPDNLLRPVQVHEATVVRVDADSSGAIGDADAIVTRGSRPVAVVTADCVPILAANQSGSVVVAIHGGWRGLAAGVVQAGIAALREEGASEELVAAIGPHVGPCCYEVDEPVLVGLERSDPEVRAAATRFSRPGHVYLNLRTVTERALQKSGVNQIDATQAHCTACDTTRFFSVRKEGAETGRLFHWIGTAPSREPR